MSTSALTARESSRRRAEPMRPRVLPFGAASPANGTYNLNGGLLQDQLDLPRGERRLQLHRRHASSGQSRCEIIRPLACRSLLRACIDLNGTQLTIQGLVTNSGVDINFATPGQDLLTIGTGGFTANGTTDISLPAPTAGQLPWELIANAGTDPDEFQRYPGVHVDRCGREHYRERSRTRNLCPLGRWIDEPAGLCLAATEGRLISVKNRSIL